ncbi:MAG: DEAD/DEAH box helicase family protein [Owenweeksia sp.]|nr:DEAD/DEAH box helicase family protein [Owenweeksia sp.]
MSFNEDSRVKIPTILHLVRLGYAYRSLKELEWDKETNISLPIFYESLQRLNPDVDQNQLESYYKDLTLLLDNEDLGKEFYAKLTDQSGIRLLDFENFDNNSFHVVTEMPCQKEEESFRPDITLLINGMPLAFIEVKIPNNREGIIKERKRIYTRFQNPKFRKFINLTQLMVFSNNMKYDDGDPEPLRGAYYATTAFEEPQFNYFREEEEFDLEKILKPADAELENFVLKDTNLSSIKHSAEFATNKSPCSPTNRICTSLFQKDRLKFLLFYSIAYVKTSGAVEKHIMRYPQLFATKAIEAKLEEGIRKGIIWHTQGSGKTALAFYNVHYLTDYYQQKGIVPKFYFIVDRLDLLIQASHEFEARGLSVNRVNSKDEFAREIKKLTAVHNHSGKREITVVNIQKFKDDPDVIRNTDYNLSLQRIYFLDEVHRSYNPKGSFLANLKESDPNAIKIGLTGTPLLGIDYNSRDLFGDYIHKYYYNASIADGYTLRLIREEIETSYKMKLAQTLEEIEILKGDVEKKLIYAHPKFVEPMLSYIVQDFENTRLRMDDNSIGGMVICDSSEQAKEMYRIFKEQYGLKTEQEGIPLAAEPQESYGDKKKQERKVKTAALILHDIGTKSEREDLVEDFKEGKIDFLFVYNMLLTGFDARRLKKLYVGRVIRSHNLLQALTRVNRTYRDHRFGYVVDFADIETEFDKTNKAYFDELQSELGDEIEHYSNLFLKPEEIEEKIGEIKDALFHFDTKNAEIFDQQVSQIQDRKTMLDITRALNEAKSLYNLIRLSGNYELLDKLDFRKLTTLSRIADGHLALINQKEQLETGGDTANLLNIALEDVLFAFRKISEEELVLADQLKDILRRTREMLGNNFDQRSPEFISLKEELERLFKKKNLSEVSKEEMAENIIALEKIYERAKENARKNELLRAKYAHDAKYARIHKRLMEKGDLTDSESKLFDALMGLKETADNQLLQNGHLLDNESYAGKMMLRLIVEQFKKQQGIPLNAASSKFINQLVMKEYLNEYQGRVA